MPILNSTSSFLVVITSGYEMCFLEVNAYSLVHSVPLDMQFLSLQFLGNEEDLVTVLILHLVSTLIIPHLQQEQNNTKKIKTCCKGTTVWL